MLQRVSFFDNNTSLLLKSLAIKQLDTRSARHGPSRVRNSSSGKPLCIPAAPGYQAAGQAQPGRIMCVKMDLPVQNLQLLRKQFVQTGRGYSFGAPSSRRPG